MRVAWICLLLSLLVAGCASSLPAQPGDVTGTPEDVIIPTNTFVPSPTPSPEPPVVNTPSAAAQCAWTWAEQALPDVSAELDQALQKAGMEDVEANAFAFGENCITGPENTVERFAAMQTDFRLAIPAEKLSDKAELGKWIERIMPVIDAIPIGSLPGPNPGQVFIRYVGADGEVNLQFSRARAKTLMEEGKAGAALYDALHVP